MKLLVDARNITPNRSGIGRYGEALMNAISDIDPENPACFSIQDSNMRRKIANFEPRPIEQKIGNVIDYLRAHKEIAPIVAAVQPDIFHSFFHIIPKRLKPKCPTILTLHDTIWIDHAEISQPTWFTTTTIREFAKRAIPDSLRRADHVICVSEATADRASEWIKPEKMTVIGHGVGASFFNAFEKNDFVNNITKSGSYICAIGNDKPYKNLKLLIDSFEQLNDESLRLVLIGKCDGFKEHIVGLNCASRIILAGMLDDEDLQVVLSHAALFVFPSLVEGFGLPILEAMAAGVPTVVSDLEPMRSVSAGASALFDPHNTDALSKAIQTSLTPEVSKKLVEKGRQHAEEQTWKVCAQKTLDVYEKVIENSN